MCNLVVRVGTVYDCLGIHIHALTWCALNIDALQLPFLINFRCLLQHLRVRQVLSRQHIWREQQHPRVRRVRAHQQPQLSRTVPKQHPVYLDCYCPPWLPDHLPSVLLPPGVQLFRGIFRRAGWRLVQQPPP